MMDAIHRIRASSMAGRPTRVAITFAIVAAIAGGLFAVIACAIVPGSHVLVVLPEGMLVSAAIGALSGFLSAVICARFRAPWDRLAGGLLGGGLFGLIPVCLYRHTFPDVLLGFAVTVVVGVSVSLSIHSRGDQSEGSKTSVP